ncbi:class I SAM-dependent DNA methyltransferase, partial [Escherichia coli]|nr:class I SAM-dependent DNA methyltransferase [Escherichia coli]
MKSLSPTLDYHEGPIGKLPFKGKLKAQVLENVVNLIAISEEDWNTEETSWGFKKHPITKLDNLNYLQASFEAFKNDVQETIIRTQQLEEFNNKEIIREYGLESELNYKVS